MASQSVMAADLRIIELLVIFSVSICICMKNMSVLKLVPKNKPVSTFLWEQLTLFPLLVNGAPIPFSLRVLFPLGCAAPHSLHTSNPFPSTPLFNIIISSFFLLEMDNILNLVGLKSSEGVAE